MDSTRTKRGAWRRSPILPRGMGGERGATLAAAPSWAEVGPEARRTDGRKAASGGAEPGPGPDLTRGSLVASEAKVRTGGCLCGAVRYEVRGEPDLVGLCHCADCRKATGGYALHYADWPASAVRIEGTLASYAGRSFCPACGSRVVHLGAQSAEVLLGTLDDPPTDLIPQREIWTIRREPWLAPVPGAEQFERDPA